MQLENWRGIKVTHPWKPDCNEHLSVTITAKSKEELEMRVNELLKRKFELISSFENTNVPKYIQQRKYYAKMKRCNSHYEN